MYDPAQVVSQKGLIEGMFMRDANIYRITQEGDEVWKIHGDFPAGGFWAIYTKSNDEVKYYAAGDGCKKYRFDPETGAILGWSYPDP